MTFVLILMVTPMAFAYTFTNIEVPSAIATYPFGIIAHGQIVGYYEDGSEYGHGFLATP